MLKKSVLLISILLIVSFVLSSCASVRNGTRVVPIPPSSGNNVGVASVSDEGKIVSEEPATLQSVIAAANCNGNKPKSKEKIPGGYRIFCRLLSDRDKASAEAMFPAAAAAILGETVDWQMSVVGAEYSIESGTVLLTKVLVMTTVLTLGGDTVQDMQDLQILVEGSMTANAATWFNMNHPESQALMDFVRALAAANGGLLTDHMIFSLDHVESENLITALQRIQQKRGRIECKGDGKSSGTIEIYVTTDPKNNPNQGIVVIKFIICRYIAFVAAAAPLNKTNKCVPGGCVEIGRTGQFLNTKDLQFICSWILSSRIGHGDTSPFYLTAAGIGQQQWDLIVSRYGPMYPLPSIRLPF